MGYLIHLEALPDFLRGERRERDHFTSNFPLGLGRPEHGFPHLCFVFGPSKSLTHVGVVLRKGDTNSTFTYKLNVIHASSVGDPIGREDLERKLHGTHRASIVKALTQGNGTLTEAADDNMVRALQALRPPFAERLQWLMNVRVHRVASPSADRWALAKDAVRAGLRIGGYSVERLDEWELPLDVEDTVLAGIKPSDYESDLIDHDSRAFPGWVPQRTNRVGVRVFADGPRRMEITSINAAPQEGKIGVDLVYYHRNSRSLILVQYKRLEGNKEVLVDKRLRRQIERMEPLQGLQREPAHHTDWRLGPDYCFLKLCRTNTPSGEIDPANLELLPGLYLPLSFLHLVLKDPRVLGPRGGAYLGYDRVERHIDNTTFFHLAKEGWIGSSGIDIKVIADVANGSIDDGSDFILAEDISEETAKERQQRSRYKGPRHRVPKPTQEQMDLFGGAYGS
ncbi:hypothetical protein AB0N89_13185 [Amycolatopsis sp. NPDC089917]|uniref:hypothetical protein n=1 Tax=Amycolatopsis sp. NPDC089917 TaxID=3155187 RepID=UPI00344927DE